MTEKEWEKFKVEYEYFKDMSVLGVTTEDLAEYVVFTNTYFTDDLHVEILERIDAEVADGADMSWYTP